MEGIQENPTLRQEQIRSLTPVGAAMSLSLAGDLTLYAVLPAYASALGLSMTTLGVLLSANRLIRLISNPLVGWLGVRFPRRRLVLTGLAAGVLSTLLYVAAQGFWVFLLGRLLWGVSWSMLYIGAYCIVLDITGDRDRGWGSGMLQTFYFIGLAGNPILGGFLSEWVGFHSALLACAGLQSVGLLWALLFLPETRPSANPGALRAWGQQRQPWRLWQFWETTPLRMPRMGELLSANTLYMLTLFIGDGIIMSTITLYLKQRYGDVIHLGALALPVVGAGGALIALRAVISAAAAPAAGRWSDRPGMRWIVCGWGVLLATAGCILLGTGDRFGFILGGIALAALGSGMLMTVLPAIVSGIAGQNSGFAIGALTTSGDIGCAVAPLVGYTLLGSLGLSQQYLIAAGLLAAGGLMIVLRFRRPAPEDA
jgi:MFS family permease